MVIAKIAIEVAKQSIKFGRRYYNLESKAFRGLYRGFPQSKTIGRGVRHGLTVGSVAGSLLNNAEDTPGNGIQKPYKPGYPSRPSNQTRSRYPRRYSSGRQRCERFDQVSRRSYPGKRYRS